MGIDIRVLNSILLILCIIIGLYLLNHYAMTPNRETEAKPPDSLFRVEPFELTTPEGSAPCYSIRAKRASDTFLTCNWSAIK